MDKSLSLKLKKVLIIKLLFSSFIFNAQVGIGTTTPEVSAELDVVSTNRGFLMPRVALSSTTDTATITGAEATSLLVYNTANVADVSPGFYYWNGTQWVTLVGATIDAWELTGNGGTNSGINFLGTTDGQDLAIRTNNTEVLRITQPDGSNDPKIIAGNAANKGDEQDPLYTFSNDNNTGMWSSGSDQLSLGAGNQEFITLDGIGDTFIVNEDGDPMNFRIETDNSTNKFFIDGFTNRVGINTGTPLTDVHIAGNTTAVRIDALNSVNNANNNGINLSAVYVDNNGDLVLGGPLISSNMPINVDNTTTFLASPVAISTSGPWTQATLHTDSITVTQDSLLEVSYQIGVVIDDEFGFPIYDGDPRLYGAVVLVNGDAIGYTANSYTSYGTSIITSGVFSLQGSGFTQVTPGTYSIQVVGFVLGGDDGVTGTFGMFGPTGERLQVIVHH